MTQSNTNPVFSVNNRTDLKIAKFVMPNLFYN